jgi:hypothetical protein
MGDPSRLTSLGRSTVLMEIDDGNAGGKVVITI